MALLAFSRCQIKRTELLAEHMNNAFHESNMLQSSWGADGITFWTVERVVQPLTQGVATYLVPSNAIAVLDVYVTPSGGYNRLLFNFSRTDYASLAVPTQQGFPTSVWQDRTLQQTLTLWPVPDNGGYTMNYYIYSQVQDANLPNGTNPAVPYYWLDAYLAELAYRLSRHHAPQLEAVRKVDAKEAYERACKQTEPSPLYITPGLSGYFNS